MATTGEVWCPPAGRSDGRLWGEFHGRRHPSKATKVTITPHYKQIVEGKSNCRTGENRPATITMNGCDYVFHLGLTTPAENKVNTYGLTTDIVCPPEKQIERHVYLGESHSTSICTLTVPPQNGLKGLHVSNTSGGHLGIVGTLEGVTITKHGLCGSGETKVGKFDIDVTVKGHDAEGEDTGVAITDEEEPPVTGQGVLTSDGPVTLTIDETENEEKKDKSNALTALGDSVACPGSTYTGHEYSTTPHELIPSKATKVTITPHYKQIVEGKSNCRTGENRPATITMNGCDYVFHLGLTTPAENKVNTYGLTTDIVCPPEKQIERHVYLGESHSTSICTLTVPPQNGLKGLHVSNTSGGHLGIVGTLEGVTITKHGLCGSGETKEGKFDIDVTVKGHDEAGDPTAISVSDEEA